MDEFNEAKSTKGVFVPAEDYLIALGLEHYSKMNKGKPTKPGATLKDMTNP